MLCADEIFARCWTGVDVGGQSGLINDSGTGTILDAAANGLLPCRFCDNCSVKRHFQKLNFPRFNRKYIPLNWLVVITCDERNDKSYCELLLIVFMFRWELLRIVGSKLCTIILSAFMLANIGPFDTVKSISLLFVYFFLCVKNHNSSYPSRRVV